MPCFTHQWRFQPAHRARNGATTQVAAEFLTRWGNLDDSGCYAMLDAPLQAFLSRGLLRQVFRQCSQPQQAKVEFPASSVQPNGSGDRDKYKLSAVTSFGSGTAVHHARAAHLCAGVLTRSWRVSCTPRW